MFSNLSIKNYALIDDINVNFDAGLTIITGETGAGKSILLGGLSLILGKRADLSMVKDTSKKCIIEGVFNLDNYNLKTFFEGEDLDYEPNTIIRREILPSGKSRAFVNDSPVRLETLQKLSSQLIDIHSQHETLELTTNAFQFKILDALANNSSLLNEYRANLEHYNALNAEYSKLKNYRANAIKELDYNVFLHNELKAADLRGNNLQQLEDEHKSLSNVEQVKENLINAIQVMDDDTIGLLNTLRTLQNTLSNISDISEVFQNIYERIESSLIELNDVHSELESSYDAIEVNPQRLEEVNHKLSEINTLLNKHNALDIDELIKIQDDLEKLIYNNENLDNELLQLETDISSVESKLTKTARVLHDNRLEAIPRLLEKLEDKLKDLGMLHAQFKIDVSWAKTYYSNGMDDLRFLFTANKGGAFKELKKSASGGELSRIMLALKAILSGYTQLPTIMFDEIDTGVSGEISKQMGRTMKQMSAFMQVFTITHLPQIAAKGDAHFKVYKTDINEVTQTQLKVLNSDERIVEIAEMLGGSKITQSAMSHAKELLN